MANLEVICPVTGKAFQATFFIEQVVTLNSRREPVAVWCSHCARSHFVSPKSLLARTPEVDVPVAPARETARLSAASGK